MSYSFSMLKNISILKVYTVYIFLKTHIKNYYYFFLNRPLFTALGTSILTAMKIHMIDSCLVYAEKEDLHFQAVSALQQYLGCQIC